MDKEYSALVFSDLEDNLEKIKGDLFQRNCQIDEKHIALSLMNSDKKQFMQSYNDKYRAKLSKEIHDFKREGEIGHKGFYENV